MRGVSITRPANRLFLLSIALGMGGIVSATQGAVIFTEADANNVASSGPPSSVANFTYSATGDLLKGLTGINTAGNSALESTTGFATLTDGAVPANLVRPGFNFSDFATLGSGGGTTVTYNLAGPSTITSIVSLGGWQDNGRDAQAYTVSYSTNGSTFTVLNTVNFNPTVAGGVPDATQVTLTSTGTALTGVVSMKFDFGAVENNYTGYDEIGVYGTPEPASLGLLGLGALGLLARRRQA